MWVNLSFQKGPWANISICEHNSFLKISKISLFTFEIWIWLYFKDFLYKTSNLKEKANHLGTREEDFVMRFKKSRRQNHTFEERNKERAPASVCAADIVHDCQFQKATTEISNLQEQQLFSCLVRSKLYEKQEQRRNTDFDSTAWERRCRQTGEMLCPEERWFTVASWTGGELWKSVSLMLLHHFISYPPPLLPDRYLESKHVSATQM